MNIRLIPFAAAFLFLAAADLAASPRVQVVVGNPGYGYGYGSYCNRGFYGPRVVNPYGYYRSTPVIVVRRAPVRYYSPAPVFYGQTRVIRGTHGYRAPIVPVNAVRNGGGFTWR